jgi:hypothetical protein
MGDFSNLETAIEGEILTGSVHPFLLVYLDGKK